MKPTTLTKSTEPDIKPTLHIRIPHRDFEDLARECTCNNTLDEGLRRIKGKLVESAQTRNARDVAYWTGAFRAFLAAKGGNASIVSTSS